MSIVAVYQISRKLCQFFSARIVFIFVCFVVFFSTLRAEERAVLEASLGRKHVSNVFPLLFTGLLLNSAAHYILLSIQNLTARCCSGAFLDFPDTVVHIAKRK